MSAHADFGVRWRPRPRDLVDGALLVLLLVTATLTLRTTFSGSAYLVAGTIGAVLGVLIAYLATGTGLPWAFVPVPLAAGYFLFGGVVALGSDPVGSALPSPGTVAELWRLLMHGWTRMLTTLAPVDGPGPLITLPFALCVVAGGLGMTIAGRTRSSGAPLIAPGLLLVAMISLGTATPGSLRLVGLTFGVLTVAWVSLRSQRRIVQTRTGWASRAGTASGMLVVAVTAVALAAPHLPGQHPSHRDVLRSAITPPLDLSAFPSPLVGFRKYRPATKLLVEQTLFTETGLPAGAPMRIAALDDYNGVVWAARNSDPVPAIGAAADTFQRVGSRIATAAPEHPGPTVSLQVTVAAGYAGATDTNGWLPTAGSLTQVRFSGADAGTHAEQLRYNLATDTAVVPDRLRAGDQYSVHAVLNSAAIPTNAEPFGGTTVNPASYNFVQAAVTKWAPQTGTPWQQMLAVASYLRTNGFYSEGGGDEAQYLPGHSTGRLTAFLAAGGSAANGGTGGLVGDDEQYAATFALMANQLGIPARVVVGAVPELTGGGVGVVKGKDVHAWVEVHIADGEWITIGQSVFMPPTTKKPDAQSVQQIENTNTSVVPPPNTSRPPSTLDEFSQAASNSFRRTDHPVVADRHWHLPAFVVTALTWGGPPVGLILLLALSILAVKSLRRRRRRRRGPPALRFALGWREVLDQARDLGLTVPGGLTRREQSEHLSAFALRPLAELADGTLFGPEPASAAASADYWTTVLRTRREMILGVNRWRRLRARLSLRSLRPLPRS